MGCRALLGSEALPCSLASHVAGRTERDRDENGLEAGETLFHTPVLSAPGRSGKIHFSGPGLPAPLGEFEDLPLHAASLNESELLEKETAGEEGDGTDPRRPRSLSGIGQKRRAGRCSN